MGVAGLVFFAIGIGIALAGALILRQNDRNPIKDDKPPTLSNRGAPLNYLIGPKRVGPFVGWIGNRQSEKEDAPGGKGLFGTTPKIKIYYESGWHQLGLGPLKSFDRITQNGKVIFDGPITPTTHPSGTTVNIGREGSFIIMWGEENQPVHTFLSDPEVLGVSSRWPYTASVFWVKKRLGPSAFWPSLEYDATGGLLDAWLSLSPQFIEGTYTLDTAHEFNVVAATNGVAGVAKIRINDRKLQFFDRNSKLKLQGNSADGDYRIRDVVLVLDEFFDYFTDIYLDEDLSGANNNGTVTPYIRDLNDGVNAAHAIAQLLMSQRPHGMGMPSGVIQVSGPHSLEELGQLIEVDQHPSSFHSLGFSIQEILTAFLMDYGVMTPLVDGKLGFYPIREEAAEDIINIPQSIIDDPLPENVNPLPDHYSSTSRINFTFLDRKRNYKAGSIMIDGDGRAGELLDITIKDVNLPTIVDFKTASKAAERRSQEELGQNIAKVIQAGRQVRQVIPGRAVTFGSSPLVFRVASIHPAEYEGSCKLEVLADYYGATTSFQTENGVGDGGPVYVPEPDYAFAPIEIPAYESDGVMTVSVLRIRANNFMEVSDIYFSEDDITYQHVLRELEIQRGGALVADLLATDPYEQTQGFVIDAPNDDILNALDLTGPQGPWRKGRQIGVIQVGDTSEIMYVRNLTALGGTLYRVDGLIRGRLGTARVAAPAGTPFYIMSRNETTPIQDILLSPGAQLYVKSVPVTFGGGLSLDDVAPVSVILEGRGIVPMDIANLRTKGIVVGRRNAYVTGGGFTLTWSYRSAASASARTGSGMQGFGDVSGRSVPQGTFRVQLYSYPVEVLKQTISDLIVNELVVTNANLVAWFGAEPAFLKVRLMNFDGTYVSNELELIIEKI